MLTRHADFGGKRCPNRHDQLLSNIFADSTLCLLACLELMMTDQLIFSVPQKSGKPFRPSSHLSVRASCRAVSVDTYV